MSVEVHRADDEDLDRWNDYLDRAPGGTVFHRQEALETLADHSGGTMIPLVGYVGQEPVGLFPVFVHSLGPFSGVFSPPPNLRIPYLGPVYLNLEKLKPRKAERRRARFLDGCFEWLDGHQRPRYVHVRTDVSVTDIRPFGWNDCDVTPVQTYVVDLTMGEEGLLDSFSSDARRNVRDGTGDLDITVGGADAIDAIVEEVRSRYREQGLSFGVTEDLVRDLHRRLPDGGVMPYVCRDDGEFLGGILALDDGDTVYRWQGGVRTDATDRPVNDLLDWRIMLDAVDRSTASYDLVGAQNRRINSYKAKFAPDLATYYSVERRSPLAGAVASLYQRIKK